MKQTKLWGWIGVVACLVSAEGAVVSVSPGFFGGFVVTHLDVPDVSTLEVGTWSGGAFQRFGDPLAVGAGMRIGGSIMGTGPASFNEAPIFLRILAPGGPGEIVFSTSSFFPVDVSNLLSSVVVPFGNPGDVTRVQDDGVLVWETKPTGSGTYALDWDHAESVPEPSVAILAILGGASFLARRRRPSARPRVDGAPGRVTAG